MSEDGDPDEDAPVSSKPRSALVEIRMVNISFPFEPYELQKDYMSAVLECLQKGWNGLLESPTGTGKTLSLLCSSLAWLEDRKAAMQLNYAGGSLPKLSAAETPTQTSSSFDFYPQVLYSSRTHSQLSQASRELKRTKYRYMNSVVLGSRDQLCINPEVNGLPNSAQKIRKCQILVNSRACEYHRNYETKVSHEDFTTNHVVDIEDLVTLGKKHCCCPYYATKILRKKSDVVFVPYNYVVDPSTRRAQGIGLERNIVIFDEAHNIESFCEDSLSFAMSSTDMAGAMKEIDAVAQNLANSEEADNMEFNVAELSVLKSMLGELETRFDKAAETDKHYDGDFIVEMLQASEIDAQHERITGLLDSLLKYIQSISSQGPWGPKGIGLQKVLDMLSTVYSGGTAQELRESFKLFFEHPKEGPKEVFVVERKKKKWELHFVCLAPGVRMKSIVQAGVHSVILTSGTLSPMGTLATELGIPFQIQLSNDHIITPDKIQVLCVPKGPDNVELISTYQNRSSEKYIRSLGLTLNEMSRRVPHGVLVFFPSFACMKALVEKWEEFGIMRRLKAHKMLLQEEPGSSSFNSTIQCYRDAVINNAQGAMLFAVCRGKSSEGVDFSDEFARAVIIVGIPYAPRQDNRVKLKIDYLNKYGSDGMNGNTWYQIQAIRAINQAIGRVIRHRNDFGVILFLDKRFAEQGTISQLSKWVRNRVDTLREFRKAIVGVSSFFQAHNECVSSRLTSFSSGNAAFVNSSHKLPSNGERSESEGPLVDVREELEKQSQKLVEIYGAGNSAGAVTDVPKGKSVLEAVEQFSKQKQSSALDNLPTLFELKRRSAPGPALKKDDNKRRKLNVPLHEMMGDGDQETESAPEKVVLGSRRDEELVAAKSEDAVDSSQSSRRQDTKTILQNVFQEVEKACRTPGPWRKRLIGFIKSLRETRNFETFVESLSEMFVEAEADISVELLVCLGKFVAENRCRFGLEILARVKLSEDPVRSSSLKKLSRNLNTFPSKFTVILIRWGLEASPELVKYFEQFPPPDLNSASFRSFYEEKIPAQREALEAVKSKLNPEQCKFFLREMKKFTIEKQITTLTDNAEFRARFSKLREDIVILFNVKFYVDFLLAMGASR
ncbi:regulator of telomere elongation helicase 1 homolog [Galendromus occidentalis]|uniref:Regulator of telomere elongation helicase 1 homolog n=1 Tax=Galendromus occidentalis TaxID=34638 RepID=A0AAJ7SF58_9ACAR|nr:regulator of telomere elongation helicase 1 homolog [Galendromus occidentalis]